MKMRASNCLVLSVVVIVISAKERKTLDDLTNTCLEGIKHKTKPGPEADLFSHCSPWKKRSCCSEEITNQLHMSDAWYNFNWNHCGDLSPNCRSHFLQDLCFYECSPNMGPWLQPVKMKIRKEKSYHIPLCQIDCNNWWNDCKNDFTCTKNWGKDFNWTSGNNICPTGSSCKRISEIYTDSADFCETVWNYSWKVSSDSGNCMHLWFDESGDNPNDAVALKRANEIINSSPNLLPSHINVYLLFSIVLYKFKSL